MKTEERIAYFQRARVRFLNSLPDGWKEIKGALTAPNGYVWVGMWDKQKQCYYRGLLKRAI